MVEGMTAKALEGKELAAVLARMRELLDGKFEGNQRRMADALGFTPTAVSDILSGTKGPGLRMLIAVARELGLTLDELLGLEGATGARWASDPRWPGLVAEARALFPKVSEHTWFALGRLSGVAPPAMTPAAVGSLAVAWDQHHTDGASAPPSVAATEKRGRKRAA